MLPMDTFTLSPGLAGKPFQPALYADADDQVRHLRNIETLAKEMDLPVQEIEPLYEDILAHMKLKARIHEYLPILVSKRVRHMLKN